jgi:hypothetical protein
MMTFDASVDFEAPGQLENAIGHAVNLVGPYDVLAVVVRHDDETAEVYRDNEPFLKPIHPDDWCVTGTNAEELAAQLRALL